MAIFFVKSGAADSRRKGQINIDVKRDDSLDDRLPAADVIIMNPPFVAWSALDTKQREQMQRILGSRLQGRGDLSMAFVSHALDALKTGGALGALFPASLLSLESDGAWRRDLLDRYDLRFIASLVS